MIAVMQIGTSPPLWIVLIGVAGMAASLAIFHWAAFSIRGRVFSYAGHDDLPQFVHTSGPYAYVRNPFYASYVLAEISTVVMWPSFWGARFIVLATLYFQWLARFEEAKFARRAVAEDYTLQDENGALATALAVCVDCIVDHTAPVSGDPRARDSPGGAAARRDGAASGAMAPD